MHVSERVPQAPLASNVHAPTAIFFHVDGCRRAMSFARHAVRSRRYEYTVRFFTRYAMITAFYAMLLSTAAAETKNVTMISFTLFHCLECLFTLLMCAIKRGCEDGVQCRCADVQARVVRLVSDAVYAKSDATRHRQTPRTAGIRRNARSCR